MDTKGYILSESDKLFCQYGIKNVTMDDIAKNIGISKKTIYQHFADKNDLVNILISNKLFVQKESIEEYMNTAENAIHEVILSIINVHMMLSSLNTKIFYDLKKYYPQALLIFNEFKENNVRFFIKSNLERGIKEKLYRADINVDIITQLRIQQTEIVLNNSEDYTKDKYNLGEVMAEITKHFLFGICNNSGLKIVEYYRKQYSNDKI